MLRNIVRNILSNWLGGTVSAVVAFLLTPYIVASLKDPSLGNQQYGVWTFIVAATAYFGLADLGIYQGILQFFTRNYSQGDVNSFNRVLAAGWTLLLATSLVTLLIAFGVSVVAPDLVEHSGISGSEIRIAFLLTAIGVLIRVALAVFNAVIVGSDSFHVLNAILIVEKLLIAGATVWVLQRGWGLIGLAAATTAGAVFEAVAKLVAAYRLVPETSVRIGAFHRETSKQIVSYGKWMFGRRITFMHLSNVDLVLVPILFGAEAGAVYGLAITFVNFAQLPLKGVAFSLTPLAISFDATGQEERLRTILLAGSRLGLAVSGVFFVGFLFWGEQFIWQWLRDSAFLWDAEFLSAATVLSIVAIDRVLLQGVIGPPRVLVAKMKVRFLSLALLFQGILAVLLAWSAGRIFGLIGVPVAMAGAALLGQAVVTVYACRVAGVPLSRFLGEAVARPMSAIALTAGTCWAIAQLLPGEGWPNLALKIGWTLLAALAWTVVISVTPQERRLFWSAIQRRRSPTLS